MTAASASADDGDRTDLLIVGGGLAGITVARTLRELGDTRSITVLSDEVDPPYDRPPLSKQVLAGTMSPEDAELMAAGEGMGIDVLLGTRAVSLSEGSLSVALDDGRSVTADDVVVATGAHARELPLLPRGTDGVHYLRTLADARSLREALLGASDVVVVGAGFIGLEVASTAASMGVRTTVLEAAPTPLTRVLGPGVGEALVAMHRGEGTEVLCGCVIVDRNEHGVVLSDGSTIPADIVVVGVGAVPNVDWLDGSGVQVDDGVVCGGDGRSSRAGVWAVGDAARWPNAVTGQHLRVEQWQSAREQANVVAHNLVGRDAVWDSVPYFWSDQCGRKIQFAGRVGADVDIRNDARGPVAVFGDEDTLVGALVTSNPRLLAELRKRIARRDAWSTAHEALS